MAKRRPVIANDLETQYSQAVAAFFDKLNASYNRLLRKMMVEGIKFNTLHRTNAIEFESFKKQLFSIRDQIAKTIEGPILKRIRSAFSRVEGRVVKQLEKTFKKAKFPIPEIIFEAAPEMIEQAISDNVALIGSIADEHTETLEAAVLSAVGKGSDFDTVIEVVEETSNQGRAKAEFIARDQIAKTYADVNEAKQRASGFDGYTWEATNDDRTRATHAALDGTFHRWDDPPLVGDRNLHPGEDFQCRCIAVPAFAP